MGFWAYAIDLAAAGVAYRALRARRGGRLTTADTLMYLYLTAVAAVTLMPILAALPTCFLHPYVPMRMRPFEDLLRGWGDPLRQIVLNVLMTVPFGFLLPLCRARRGKPCGLLRCALAAALMSTGIELLQPLLSTLRRADITDVITNTLGAVIGRIGYRFFRRLL